MPNPRSPDFEAAWRKLSDEGKCSSVGGKDYKRILKEWLEEGRYLHTSSIDAGTFIRARMGKPPSEPMPRERYITL